MTNIVCLKLKYFKKFFTSQLIVVFADNYSVVKSISTAINLIVSVRHHKRVFE